MFEIKDKPERDEPYGQSPMMLALPLLIQANAQPASPDDIEQTIKLIEDEERD